MFVRCLKRPVMVLRLCALFISLTLVALSLDDIVILHVFNAKRLFIKRQLMFIRGNTLKLQHVMLPVRYVLALDAICLDRALNISTMQLTLCMCTRHGKWMLKLFIGSMLVAQELWIGTRHNCNLAKGTSPVLLLCFTKLLNGKMPL